MSINEDISKIILYAFDKEIIKGNQILDYDFNSTVLQYYQIKNIHVSYSKGFFQRQSVF